MTQQTTISRLIAAAEATRRPLTEAEQIQEERRHRAWLRFERQAEAMANGE